MTKTPDETYGEARPVDLEGLASVEASGQGLAAAVEFVLRYSEVPWRFLLVSVEYRGGGCSFVTNASDRGEMVCIARSAGERLRERRLAAQVSVRKALGRSAAAVAGSISEESLDRLAGSVEPLTDVIGRTLPKGWGFALLLYDPAPDLPGYLYASSAERESMATALLESADRWERNEDRPPGRFGKDA